MRSETVHKKTNRNKQPNPSCAEVRAGNSTSNLGQVTPKIRQTMSSWGEKSSPLGSTRPCNKGLVSLRELDSVKWSDQCVSLDLSKDWTKKRQLIKPIIRAVIGSMSYYFGKWDPRTIRIVPKLHMFSKIGIKGSILFFLGR